MPKLQINKLHFSYTDETEVLKNITLTLEKESTAIIGQNGSGKTTFVKLLKGLLKPTSGTIHYNGVDITEYTAAKLAKHIGMVFQNPNDQIFKNKVIDEVLFGPLNIGQSQEDANKNAIEALKKVGMDQYLEKNPYDLSLAERKMISIASVLAMKPDVIIFDEPTMGQDYKGKQLIKEIIYECRKQGKLVLCILHDMDFAAEVFERIIVLNQGKVLLDGNPREVFTNEQVLKQAHLEQPYIMQIAKQLNMKGIFLTEEELIAEYRTTLLENENS